MRSIERKGEKPEMLQLFYHIIIIISKKYQNVVNYEALKAFRNFTLTTL